MGDARTQLGVSERIAEENKSSWMENKKKDHINIDPPGDQEGDQGDDHGGEQDNNPEVEGEQRNMTTPPIKIPLQFYDGTKQWDLHGLQLKCWGIVNGISQGIGGTPEWHESLIHLSLTGQAQGKARELKKSKIGWYL